MREKIEDFWLAIGIAITGLVAGIAAALPQVASVMGIPTAAATLLGAGAHPQPDTP